MGIGNPHVPDCKTVFCVSNDLVPYPENSMNGDPQFEGTMSRTMVEIQFVTQINNRATPVTNFNLQIDKAIFSAQQEISTHDPRSVKR